MSKAYIGAGLGIIIIAAGAYYAFGRGSGSFTGQDIVVATSTAPATLRELAATQTPQQCAFTGAHNSKGTVYVAQGKVRGDFSAQVGGKDVMGHLIVADNTSYVWMDSMSTGFKNSFEATSSASTASSQGMSPDEHVSYTCKPWAPDQNVFTLPAGITFSAMADMQAKAAAGAMGAQCGQCDAISDATAKKQCLAALHC